MGSWDLWKHKTTEVGQHADCARVCGYVGPRVLAIVDGPCPEPVLRSLDLTSGAWRYSKKTDASPGDEARYTICREKLADRLPRGRSVKWAFPEDNVLAFIVSLGFA